MLMTNHTSPSCSGVFDTADRTISTCVAAEGGAVSAASSLLRRLAGLWLREVEGAGRVGGGGEDMVGGEGVRCVRVGVGVVVRMGKAGERESLRFVLGRGGVLGGVVVGGIALRARQRRRVMCCVLCCGGGWVGRTKVCDGGW